MPAQSHHSGWSAISRRNTARAGLDDARSKAVRCAASGAGASSSSVGTRGTGSVGSARRSTSRYCTTSACPARAASCRSVAGTVDAADLASPRRHHVGSGALIRCAASSLRGASQPPGRSRSASCRVSSASSASTLPLRTMLTRRSSRTRRRASCSSRRARGARRTGGAGGAGACAAASARSACAIASRCASVCAASCSALRCATLTRVSSKKQRIISPSVGRCVASGRCASLPLASASSSGELAAPVQCHSTPRAVRMLVRTHTRSDAPISSRQPRRPSSARMSSPSRASPYRRRFAPADLACLPDASSAACEPPCFRRVVYRWNVLCASTTTERGAGVPRARARADCGGSWGFSATTAAAKWPPPSIRIVQRRSLGSGVSVGGGASPSSLPLVASEVSVSSPEEDASSSSSSDAPPCRSAVEMFGKRPSPSSTAICMLRATGCVPCSRLPVQPCLPGTRVMGSACIPTSACSSAAAPSAVSGSRSRCTPSCVSARCTRSDAPSPRASGRVSNHTSGERRAPSVACSALWRAGLGERERRSPRSSRRTRASSGSCVRPEAPSAASSPSPSLSSDSTPAHSSSNSGAVTSGARTLSPLLRCRSTRL